MWRAWILLMMSLTACAEFPQVDAALSADAARLETPKLLPFEQLLTAEEPRLTETDDEELRARAEGLRNRADGLRRPVIEPDTRDRMETGVTPP
ncbi:hypothetical protein [Marivita sp. S2033]|uniref:hypothetical protein n=1 Tax=Marivita sp. S2033 TaxID=3373187 RepID=UPI003982CFC6